MSIIYNHHEIDYDLRFEKYKIDDCISIWNDNNQCFDKATVVNVKHDIPSCNGKYYYKTLYDVQFEDGKIGYDYLPHALKEMK